MIQGTADVGKKLTEDELQKTMDFCIGWLSLSFPGVFDIDVSTLDIFAPTDPDMHEAVGARIQPELMLPNQPILTDEEISRAVDPDDEDAKLVLHRVNARKPVNEMYKGMSNLRVEGVNGFVAHLERGRLGLIRENLSQQSETEMSAEINRAVPEVGDRSVSVQA